jgi:2-polyprenyl-6-hydroxyphenyl methylase/3-demethylubiquinone-9 3-methyltransferase
MTTSTIAPDEIEKFSRIADEWWDMRGKFAPLHKINPLRIEYIKSQILSLREGVADEAIHDTVSVHDGSSRGFAARDDVPLHGIRLLDIGCGGGLIAEPMARLGARVTAIDASEKNIKVASLHAEKSGLDIDYRCMSAEEMVEVQGARGEGRESEYVEKENVDSRPLSLDLYDVVLALEIIEHVADIGLFVKSVMQLVKPDGLVVFSTINRTAKAFALAIVGAEYVLRWLPRGTHDWNKFVKPSELLAHVEASGGALHHVTGMVMNPLTFQWSLNEHDVGVNYLMCVKR